MQKGRTKKLIFEDKFERKYACWANNHCHGWNSYKTANRRTVRRKLKKETRTEIREEQYYAEII